MKRDFWVIISIWCGTLVCCPTCVEINDKKSKPFFLTEDAVARETVEQGSTKGVTENEID